MEWSPCSKRLYSYTTYRASNTTFASTAVPMTGFWIKIGGEAKPQSAAREEFQHQRHRLAAER